jgi:COMPASS component SWD2
VFIRLLLTLPKLFRRDENEDAKNASVTSLDFDDQGELLLTSDTDETMMLYNVKDGRHLKKLNSKKYGVKLAKFTHSSSSVIYASTKVDSTLSDGLAQRLY